MSELFGKKYRVTPETSKLLQEAVFAAGGRWWGGKCKIDTNHSCIYVRSNGRITHGFDMLDHFQEHSLPEGDANKLLAPPITAEEGDEIYASAICEAAINKEIRKRQSRIAKRKKLIKTVAEKQRRDKRVITKLVSISKSLKDE